MSLNKNNPLWGPFTEWMSTQFKDAIPEEIFRALWAAFRAGAKAAIGEK